MSFGQFLKYQYVTSLRHLVYIILVLYDFLLQSKFGLKSKLWYKRSLIYSIEALEAVDPFWDCSKKRVFGVKSEKFGEVLLVWNLTGFPWDFDLWLDALLTVLSGICVNLWGFWDLNFWNGVAFVLSSKLGNVMNGLGLQSLKIGKSLILSQT